jgi:hypothetical protein
LDWLAEEVGQEEEGYLAILKEAEGSAGISGESNAVLVSK